MQAQAALFVHSDTQMRCPKGLSGMPLNHIVPSAEVWVPLCDFVSESIICVPEIAPLGTARTSLGTSLGHESKSPRTSPVRVPSSMECCYLDIPSAVRAYWACVPLSAI